MTAGSARPAAAQNDSSRVTWEYMTANVDTGTLQTKLNELGEAGWEVFSVSPADSKSRIGAGFDPAPHCSAARCDGETGQVQVTELTGF